MPPAAGLGDGAMKVDNVEAAFGRPPTTRSSNDPNEWANQYMSHTSTNLPRPHGSQHGAENPLPLQETHRSSWTSERDSTNSLPLAARSTRAAPPGARDMQDDAVSPRYMPGTLMHTSSPRSSYDGSDITVYRYEDTRDTSDAVSPGPPSQFHPSPHHVSALRTLHQTTNDSKFREELESKSSESYITHGQYIPEEGNLSITSVVPSPRQEGREEGARHGVASWKWVVSFGLLSEALSTCLAALGAVLYSDLAGDHLPAVQAMAVAAVTALVAIVLIGGSFAGVALWRREKGRTASRVHRTMNLVQEMDARRASPRLRDDLVAQVVCAMLLLLAVTALPLGMAASGKPDGFRAREGVLVNAVAIGVLTMACLSLGLPVVLVCLWRRRRRE